MATAQVRTWSTKNCTSAQPSATQLATQVMLKPGASAEPDELLAHVRDDLGGYKTPKTIQVVAELPVSAVGKVLRRKVRDKYWTESQRNVG